jgi:hypothetical protein
MIRIIVSIFIILHGIVHGLYTGQSFRLFELQDGMDWPDRSWLYSRLFNSSAYRWLTGLALALVGIAFLTAGIGLLANQQWWRVATIMAAVFSSTLFLLSWDGSMKHLPDQGLLAIFINLVMLGLLIILDWPT